MPCRVCHSPKLEQFLDLGDQPHCDSLLLPKDLAHKEPYYPLQVCFCHECHRCADQLHRAEGNDV